MGSKRFTINIQDLVGVVKTAGLVALAAGLTSIAQNLGSIDFGQYGALFVPVVTMALDGLIKLLKNGEKEDSKEV